MPYLDTFGPEFENNIAIFEINTLEFVLLQNFVKNEKMPKFGTKNSLFRYFWARNLKNYCHIWHKYPRICQIQWYTHTVIFVFGCDFSKVPWFTFSLGSGPLYKVCPENMLILHTCSFQKKMLSNLTCALIYSLILKTAVFWKFCKTCRNISMTDLLRKLQYLE